jgi:hypothetical protein
MSSLLAAYKEQLRKKIGLSEDPMTAAPDMAAGGDMGGGTDLGGIDENTINTMLELLQKEIAARTAGGEQEGMEDPAVAGTNVPEAGTPDAAICKEAEMMADDVYFEMLNTFKTNIANCEDATKKDLYRKGYNLLYKMRDKFIKEMTACDAPEAPVAK